MMSPESSKRIATIIAVVLAVSLVVSMVAVAFTA